MDNKLFGVLDNIDFTVNGKEPVVAIKCCTYNQEQYLRDALDGFVMQKTDFPFIAIVHDDASTDGTAAIIREYAEKYPDIIKPVYEEENQYSKKDGSLSRIMNEAVERSGAEYIALCEGDDYWIDPNKLQLQVDFLSSHPDYSMCYTQSKIFQQASKKYFKYNLGTDLEGTIDLIKEKYTIPTASMVYRADCIDSGLRNIQDSHPNWKMGDLVLSLYLSLKGNLKYFNTPTSVYRILSASACHFDNFNSHRDFILSAYDVKNYFGTKISIEENIISRINNNLNLELCRSACTYGNFAELKKYARQLTGNSIKSIIYKMVALNRLFFKSFVRLLWLYEKKC